MKKVLCVLLVASLLMLSITVMADEKDDRIAALEERVTALETTVADLTDVVNGLTNNSSGKGDNKDSESSARPGTDMKDILNGLVNSASSQSQKEDLEAPEVQPTGNIIVEYEGSIFAYDHYEVVDNSEGKCLLLYGNFQNNGDDATSAMFTFHASVYQNSRELDTAYVQNNEYYTDSMTNILPGGNIDVAFAYQLQDMSDVTVEISALFDLFKESNQQFVICLQ